MDRREFLAMAAAPAMAAMPAATVRVMTQPPKHHFFGYYGITPWNKSQTRLVCLEVDFQDRLPQAGEKARIGFVDAVKGGFQGADADRDVEPAARVHAALASAGRRP